MHRLALIFLLVYCSVFWWPPITASNGKSAAAARTGLSETTVRHQIRQQVQLQVQQQVYTSVYTITIDKSDHKLYLYYGDKLRNWFLVGTGRKAYYTPTGNFKVINKAKYPTYEGIPGGSPKNPLGARWLGLNKVSENGKRYGIHGTNNPRSIGKNSSGGCIRMYNQDVIFLYNLVPVGIKVKIQE